VTGLLPATELQSHDQLFIGGRWATPAGTGRIDVVSPRTEEIVASVPEATPTDIDRAVAAARDAFDHGSWPRLEPAERVERLRPFAARFTDGADELAPLITEEIGSPITFSVLAQAGAPAAMISTFLDLAARHPWVEQRPTAMGGEAIVRRLPVGVVGAIVPWNVPQIVTMSKLIPALLAGCTVVVKPAPEAPLDALWVAGLLEATGLPEGVVSILPAGREAGEHLVRHHDVDMVAFTGSTTAGRQIGQICGQRLRRASLELGGKSAAIVLDDADLERTVEGLRFASFMNTGQACAAQTRVLAPRSRYEEVVDALATMVADLAVGAPRDEATEIGPLVAARQRDRVLDYIALGEAEGARTVAGGIGRPPGVDHGWYVRPTVFADVDNRMRIAREEIFGPVLTVIAYDGDDEAVDLANDSDYGLAGSVWTADRERGVTVAGRVRTGTTAVNHYAADFGSPFGGFKDSGLGREYGPEGLDEYVEFQSVSVLGTD
jgi:betaine-aldehyde dehydrogenase